MSTMGLGEYLARYRGLGDDSQTGVATMSFGTTGWNQPLAPDYAGYSNLPVTIPDFLAKALAQAKISGYSIPYNIGQAGPTAGVWFANPNGTTGWGTPDNWARANSSFVMPPQSVIDDYLAANGYATYKAQIEAMNAAVIAASQQAAAAAAAQGNTGVSPNDYNPATQVLKTPNTGIIPVTTSTGATPGAPMPVLTFQTTRGYGSGQTVQPGDSWLITITGGGPNTRVQVSGGKNGQNITNDMGVADSNGKFVLQGAFTSADVGSWAENWTIGGVNAGSIGFVVAVPSSQSSSVSPTATNQPTNTTNTGTTTSTGTSTTTSGAASGPPSGFALGLQALFNPSQWGAVFSSGDTMEIMGLLAPLAIGAYMVKGLISKR